MADRTRDSKLYAGHTTWLAVLNTETNSWTYTSATTTAGKQTTASEYINKKVASTSNSVAVPTIFKGPLTDLLEQHKKEMTSSFALVISDRIFFAGGMVYPTFGTTGPSDGYLMHDTEFMNRGPAWFRGKNVNGLDADSVTVAADQKVLIVASSGAGTISLGSAPVDTVVTNTGLYLVDIGAGEHAVTNSSNVEGYILVGTEYDV